MFGASAQDSTLMGDDQTTTALRSPTTLQVGDGTDGGFSEVFVST